MTKLKKTWQQDIIDKINEAIAKRASQLKKTWQQDIIDKINEAIADRSISKEELVDGLYEIEDQAGDWARQLRRELEGKEQPK